MTKTPTVPAISRGLSLRVEVERLPELSSDHNPISITFEGGAVSSGSAPRRVVDWGRLVCNASLRSYQVPVIICDTSSLDTATEHLTPTITDALAAASTPATFREGQWLPGDLREMIRAKRSARKRAQLTLYPGDIAAANRMAAELRDKLVEFRDRQWWDKVSSLSICDGSLYKMTKALKLGRTRRADHPLHGSSGLVYDDAGKAEAFADHFERVFGGVDDGDSDDDSLGEPEGDDPPPLRSDRIPPVTLEEIGLTIDSLKKGKAPGPDNITNATIKRVPESVREGLATIINAIFDLQAFPSTWKRANVVVIPKKDKDALFPQNHRPISLILGLAKQPS